MRFFLIKVDSVLDRVAAQYVGMEIVFSDQKIYPKGKFKSGKTVFFLIEEKFEAFGKIVAECDSTGYYNVTPEESITDPGCEDRARCSGVAGSPGPARGGAAPPHCPACEDRARCSGVAGSPGPARGGAASPHSPSGERLALQVQLLNKIVEEMQTKIVFIMNTMGLQSNPFNSNHGVKEEAAPAESTQRCNPVLPSTSSVAQNHHDDPSIRANDAISRNKINTPLTRNESSNVVLSEMNKNRFQNRRPTTTSQEERTTERANSSDSDADNEVPADMIPIGSGKTLIPRHVYAHIDWTSYTKATRKLLMAVFPRRTLATHSLTGKASPAFTSKPAKLQLDIKKVSDIVMSVVENCRVREGHVRSCITTKCADENKMYNMRQKKKANKKKAGEEIDRENSPPLRARGTEHRTKIVTATLPPHHSVTRLCNLRLNK